MDGMSLAFYFLAAITIAGGLGVALATHIVYSALSLMVSFFGVAGLYVLLHADFVAGVQVLVYVGGVLVLTLFAVMLTQGIRDVRISNTTVGPWPATAAVFVIFALMQRAMHVTEWHVADGLDAEATVLSTHAIGDALLGRYILPFEVASLLLLAVLIGAVVITRKETGELGG